MICQLSWKTLPGLRGFVCSEFRAVETRAPDNERGVAVAFENDEQRDALLAELETHFAAQRFSNNAAAFEAVKTYVLERARRETIRRIQRRLSFSGTLIERKQADQWLTRSSTKRRLCPVDIEAEMKKSYLDYSMSVIIGRALPDVRDGLKPVHRRILFGMHEMGLTSTKPYRKCAKITGEVLGKFHPARRRAGVRRPGAHGPALQPALSAGGWPGQLRLGRRRSARGHALHRSAPGAHQRRAARRHRERNRRLHSQFRRDRARADRPPDAHSQPAGQWRQRHRRGHGHEYSAAQPERDHRSRRPACREARRLAQGTDEIGSRSGLPHRRLHRRPRRNRAGLQAPAAAASSCAPRPPSSR